MNSDRMTPEEWRALGRECLESDHAYALWLNTRQRDEWCPASICSMAGNIQSSLYKNRYRIFATLESKAAEIERLKAQHRRHGTGCRCPQCESEMEDMRERALKSWAEQDEREADHEG